MKKALIVASVFKFLNFEKNDIKILQEMGYEVHTATNMVGEEWLRDDGTFGDLDLHKHQIDFSRSPFSKDSIKAFKQLRELLKEHNFNIIHCHTPSASAITRVVAKKARKSGTKVIYTAHGFHFFKGASVKNWLIFYPIEKVLSRYTDILITINKEDYTIASSKFYSKKIEYIPGVGIDTQKFKSGNVSYDDKRRELGLGESDIMLMSVGELSVRKNHKIVIEALIKLNNPRIHYFICGVGELEEKLKKIVDKNNYKNNVHFLGYRNDISELCDVADLFLFPSFQEGLPVALMEAISCKTPVICSNIRGNEDLIVNESDLFNPRSVDSLILCLNDKLAENPRERMIDSVENNYRNLEKYDIKNVSKIMERIYGGVS